MAHLFISVAVFLLSIVGAHAQTWPDRPVKIIVGFPAGGGSDAMARVLADRLGNAFGQRFIVENRPGAGGGVAAEAVVRSAPDGYTLLVASPAEIVINQNVYKSVSYDALKDLAPITLIGWTPLIIAVHPDLKASSPAEFVALLRGKPGQLNYSTPGAGSGHHLAGEYLKKVAGVDMQHVAYRGAAPAVQDAVAGHVPITISGLPPVVELIKSDKLLAVAVTSAKRSAVFPNTIALAELGPEYKDFDLTNWFGFLAPAGVPEDIRKRLSQAAVSALKEPAVIARIAEQGAEAVGNSPEEFAAFIRAEADKYARIAKVTGVRANP